MASHQACHPARTAASPTPPAPADTSPARTPPHDSTTQQRPRCSPRARSPQNQCAQYRSIGCEPRGKIAPKHAVDGSVDRGHNRSASLIGRPSGLKTPAARRAASVPIERTTPTTAPASTAPMLLRVFTFRIALARIFSSAGTRKIFPRKTQMGKSSQASRCGSDSIESLAFRNLLFDLGSDTFVVH
jgi:hypothetical protein